MSMTKTKTVEGDNVEKTDVESKVEVENTETKEETIDPLKGDIDYEKLLEEEKQKTATAEKATADLAFKLREAKRKGEDVEEEVEEKPLTQKQLTEILDKREQKIKNEALKPVLEGIAKDLASSDAEAQLILEIHKNRVWPEGSTLAEQLSDAQAIANKGRLSAVNSELKRALKSKGTKSDTNLGTFRDNTEKTDTVMSANDVQGLISAGYVFNTADGLYKKKLPGNKTLCHDPKTHKTFKV